VSATLTEWVPDQSYPVPHEYRFWLTQVIQTSKIYLGDCHEGSSSSTASLVAKNCSVLIPLSTDRNGCLFLGISQSWLHHFAMDADTCCYCLVSIWRRALALLILVQIHSTMSWTEVGGRYSLRVQESMLLTSLSKDGYALSLLLRI